MRVAIVHYWFLVLGGGERVVETLGDMFPQADIFVLFADPESIPESLRSHKITTSILNRSKLARRFSRQLFPLYPAAIELLDLSGYDLIITSDSPPIKGVRTRPGQLHICYCHTPGRYIWDSHASFKESLPALTRPFFSMLTWYVRRWDWRAAQRVEVFVANSNFVAKRIKMFYQRDSVVIYPPCNTTSGFISDTHDDYYLHVGRLVASKRVDLLIEACNRLGRKLLIAGTGREEQTLRPGAGPTVKFRGRVDDYELPGIYARCRALLFAAEEDFGIVPVEAQSYGRPVIAYGAGGSLETVRTAESGEAPTGIYFNEQTVESLMDGILRFEAAEKSFDPIAIQEFARTFDSEVFVRKMRRLIDQNWAELCQSRTATIYNSHTIQSSKRPA
jgi:glycosyltransferase involved in cell wall biosynthesis